MSSPERFICQHVRGLEGYTPGEQPQVPGLVKLNTNENPYPPSPRVMEVLKSFADSSVRIYPDPVCRSLREKIASRVGCGIEQVFVGNGSDEVLALCTRAFVEDHGAIASFNPSYSLYPVLSAIRPAQMKLVDLNDDFTWRMPDGFSADLFYLTNPNAPTSMAFPREKIRDFCRRFSGLVLIDEAYVDFAPEHCMDLALEFSNVLVSRSFSKSYSLAGARVGYVVGHADLISALFKIKDSYNVNAITQALALAAFEDEAHMRSNVANVISTREKTAKQLAALGYHVCPSAANFLWARPPAGKNAAEIFAGLRERNILIRYFPGAKTGDYLRVTIGLDEHMDRFMLVIAELTKR
jgi:histidinol-phosphate aminotransferase